MSDQRPQPKLVTDRPQYEVKFSGRGKRQKKRRVRTRRGGPVALWENPIDGTRHRKRRNAFPR